MTVTPPLDSTLYMTDVDRGVERASRMIDMLPPYLADDPQVRSYVSTLARELDRIEAAMNAMRDGAFPLTADLRMLAIYEALFGLSNTSLTLTQRRTDVVAHMRKRGVASRYDWQQALDAFIATPGGWSYAEAPPYTVNLTVPVDPSGNRVPVITAYARAVTPAHLALVVNGSYGGFKVGIDHIGVDAL